jgi:hypothetical protein
VLITTEADNGFFFSGRDEAFNLAFPKSISVGTPENTHDGTIFAFALESPQTKAQPATHFIF